MHQFNIHTPMNAPAAARKSLASIESIAGFVPNVFGLLAHAPEALGALVSLNQFFENTHFSVHEREIVSLVASVENECQYCVAGHSAFASHHGIDPGVVDAIREQREVPDTRIEALRLFTALMVRSRGEITNADVERFLAAGFRSEQVLEVLIGIAAKTITNYASKLAAIPIDEQFSDFSALSEQAKQKIA